MDKIQPGKYVEIAYDLYASLPGEPETQVHTVEPADPERFIFGITPGLIPALASALEGLEQGKSPPRKAYRSTPTTWHHLTATSSLTTKATSTRA